MIGAAINSRLSNATTAGSRIYPQVMPQTPTVPAVTYQQVIAVRTHAMGGDASIVRVRVQVDCWAKTYAEVQTLAAQVRDRLSRWQGTAAGVTVHDVLLDDEVEQYESDTQLRRVIQDYSFFVTT